MKILLTIEYKGTNFSGWQNQPGKRTVQNEIECALKKLFGKNISLYGSGRTDSGVHALAQQAHFEVDKSILLNKIGPPTFDKVKLLKAINANLPKDIKIHNAKSVNKNFHARYDAVEKIYLYKLHIGHSPLLNDLVGECKNKLNISRMQEGAKYLIGSHDFTSFSSAKTKTNDRIRTINYIKINKKGNLFTFEISGNGFLYNMIRIIIGTLADVGMYKLEPKNIKTILENKDRTKAGKTVQACGLYLKKVRY